MNASLIDNLSKIRLYILMAVIASLPFGIKLNSLLIVTYSILALVNLFIEPKPSPLLKWNWALLLPLLWFVLHIVFLINTSVRANGYFEIEKRAAFGTLIIFLFLDRPIVEQKRKTLICLFIATFNIYEISSALKLLWVPRLGQSSPTIREVFFNFRDLYDLSTNDIFEMHTTFFGLYATVSMTFALELIFTSFVKDAKLASRAKASTLFLIASIILNILFSILISSRMPFFLLVIVLCSYLYRFRPRIGKLLYALPVALVLAFVLFMVFSKTMKERFLKEFMDPVSYQMPRGRFHNSLNMRLAQLYCSKEIISENFIIGVGVGDVQKELNACYISNEFSTVMVEHKMDSHNEFLETWMRTGILGIGTLLALFVYSFIEALRRHNWLFFNFMAIIFISMFTETILSSQKGVVLFVLFYSLLALQSIEVKTKLISEK